jgi:hypothetical protein
MKKLFFYLLVFYSITFFFSCTALTTLQDNYTNKDFKDRQINKVVVFVKSRLHKNTFSFKKIIISELKKMGIDAILAEDVLSKDLLEPPKDQEHYEWMISKIQLRLGNLGIDNILFSFIAGETESIDMHNLNLSGSLFGNTSGGQPLSRISSFPEYSTRIYFISNLCDVISGDIIWSARSETINPYSTTDLGKSYITAIIDEFRDEGFVK